MYIVEHKFVVIRKIIKTNMTAKYLRAHVHEDFCAKFVEYARKIQRNATFLLHRPFTVTTDGAQVMQEKSHVVARNGKTRG